MEDLLGKCLKLVILEFNRGNPEEWSPKNFEKLSAKINEKSGIVISAHTLKRLYGKVKTHEEYDPQDSTKDALVKYIGFKDWDEFVDKNGVVPTIKFKNDSTKKNNGFIYKVLISIVTVVFVIIISKIYSNYSASAGLTFTLDSSNLQGVYPQTAVFNYHLKTKDYKIDFGDFKSEDLDPTKKSITHSYLFPDYFVVKLLKKEKILKKINIQVLSNNWFGDVIYREENNRQEHLYQIKEIYDTVNGYLYISPNKIFELGIPKKQDYWTEFRYINDINADGDNFSVEFNVRNNEENGGMRCFDFIYKILCEHGIYEIRFLHKGCIQFINMIIADQVWNGKDNNLETFGRDLSKWSKINMNVSNKRATITFENDSVFNTTYNQSLGKIKGMILVFKGTGAADYVKLWNKEKIIVFDEGFNLKAH